MTDIKRWSAAVEKTIEILNKRFRQNLTVTETVKIATELVNAIIKEMTRE